MRQIRTFTSSARLWAALMVFSAIGSMCVPHGVKASECGPCGAGACMGPAGCMTQGATICYGNNVLMQCLFNYESSCAELKAIGTCGT